MGAITDPVTDVVLEYRECFPPLRNGCKVVPWYDIERDPEEFAALLLRVAAGDPVCQAMTSRASERWMIDFAIGNGRFVADRVQEQYLKQLRNWLSPLSGNLGRREAHLIELEQQYAAIWRRYDLDADVLRDIARHRFFSLNVAGRRDRAQIYRNITEAARALVGEVTSWPSRQVEKISVLCLLRSPLLAALQRRILSVVITDGWVDRLRCHMWEYLPYYLRGVPLERVDEQIARPRVLGALHDCLAGGEDTRDLVDESLIAAFEDVSGGREYERWRMLPPVIRNQVMLSDLARILPGGKIESGHTRLQFEDAALARLPDLDGFSSWPVRTRQHKVANPHDPGREFPFAAGWVRNEFCPNVVSSRLLLAPLYAGTSGHTQGRILAWRALRSPTLADVPVGLVIAVGYSVLWRLYYDKRVSGFHTLFEALQGTHVDDEIRVVPAAPSRRPEPDDFLPPGTDDDVMNLLLECSSTGRVDVRAFWLECLKRFGSRGPAFTLVHTEQLAREREATMRACPGAIIPHWNETEDPGATAPEVMVWTPEENRGVLEEIHAIYNRWAEEAASVPLPPDDDEW